MKKVAVIGSLLVVLALFWASPALAQPNENASHLAFCAVTMGGQHVAECARNMPLGVSQCAQMVGLGLCDADACQ